MKTITVPVSTDAMRRLDYDENIEGDLLELSISDEYFYELEERGLFDEINRNIGCNIDDFEDESITRHYDLIKVRDIVNNHNKNKELDRLLSMVDEAIKLETGIFFFM